MIIFDVSLTYCNIWHLGKNIIVDPSAKTHVSFKYAHFSFLAVSEQRFSHVESTKTTANNSYITTHRRFASTTTATPTYVEKSNMRFDASRI